MENDNGAEIGILWRIRGIRHMVNIVEIRRFFFLTGITAGTGTAREKIKRRVYYNFSLTNSLGM